MHTCPGPNLKGDYWFAFLAIIFLKCYTWGEKDGVCELGGPGNVGQSCLTLAPTRSQTKFYYLARYVFIRKWKIH